MKNFGETMDDFRKQVANLLNKNLEAGAEKASFSQYLVKITTDALNIRKGAGTNTTKVGCIRDRGVYTIVEESSGQGAKLWGKLKSGVGWIALDYTKRI